MSIGSYFMARAAKLPKARFRVTRNRGLRVPMRDGIDLETDLFVPRNGVRSPTIMIRVPYGLRGFDTVGEIYAERGYNAVIQACRGTAKSGGEFEPLTRERDDGLDTLSWIKSQPWFKMRFKPWTNFWTKGKKKLRFRGTREAWKKLQPNWGPRPKTFL